MALKLAPITPHPDQTPDPKEQDAMDMGYIQAEIPPLTFFHEQRVLNSGEVNEKRENKVLAQLTEKHLFAINSQLSINVIDSDLRFVLENNTRALKVFADLVDTWGLYRVLTFYPNQYIVDGRYYKVRFLQGEDHIFDIKIEINSEELSYSIVGSTTKMQVRDSDLNLLYIEMDQVGEEFLYKEIELEA